MLLDFNTPGASEAPNKAEGPSDHFQGKENPETAPQEPEKLNNPGRLFVLLAFSGVLALSSLAISLITLKNLPKPEPVVINCHPDLLKKIENQAAVLSEIAEIAESSKARK